MITVSHRKERAAGARNNGSLGRRDPCLNCMKEPREEQVGMYLAWYRWTRRGASARTHTTRGAKDGGTGGLAFF
jgi:hypothetical protein